MKPSKFVIIAIALIASLAGCDNSDPTRYTITIDPEPTGGSITIDPDELEYDYNDTVTITATPESGYTFESWGGDVELDTENPTILIMDKDKTITATFAAIPTYTITIDPTPTGGSIALDPASGPYTEDTAVTVTATAESGYTFTSWGGDLTGSTNPETLTMDADKTITATFTADPTWTVTIDPTPTHGTITLDPATGPYADGSTVTATATADIGYSFTGWSGDLTGTTNPETLTMDADKAISATFVYDGDVYVRTTGLDTNPGTPEEPVQSIPRAFEIIAADDGVGIIHIAAGTYEVDYSSGTHIVAVEGVSLYGGYAALDWADRDVTDVYADTAHQSILEDISSSGSGSIVVAARVIDVGATITAATVFDGLYIRGGAAGTNHTTGVYIDEGTPTITNCYINGGGGGYTTAVYINDSDGLVFSSNHIIGGDMVDTESTGLYAEFSTLTITNNTIDGGCGGGNVSTALDIMYTTAEVSGNDIIGGTGGSARGFYIDGDSYVDIIGNTIHASNTTANSGDMTGILTWSGDTNIVNNVINVNGVLDWHYPIGIRFSGNDTNIINNTIQVSNVNNGDYYGIYASSAYSGTIIENNIITSEGGLGTGTAIAISEAVYLENNNLHGFDYYTSLTTDCADLDTTTVTTGAGTETLASFGNIDIALIDNGGVDYFVDPDGLDDDLTTTEDNDFHLTTDAVILNVREGGIDETDEAVFPTDGTDPIDLDGTVRTASTTTATNPFAAGWSMGAYEQD